MYRKQWNMDLWNDSRTNTDHANKLRNYRGFKQDCALEPYLLYIKDRETRSSLTKLRISAHKLQIEKGRYYPQRRPVKERTCTFCGNVPVESEVHFLMYCDLYCGERGQMFENIQSMYPVFDSLPEVEKYHFLMTVNEADACHTVARFVRDSIRRRSQIM